MKMAKHIAAYIATGTKVINRVEKEEELEPVVAFSTDVEVELSRDDPTLGSELLTFYTSRCISLYMKFDSKCGGGCCEVCTYEIPRQQRGEVDRSQISHIEGLWQGMRTSSGGVLKCRKVGCWSS
jgi:hypothetical protein